MTEMARWCPVSEITCILQEVSWLFFKARTKCPYLNHTGRESNAEKQPTGPGPEGCDQNGPAAALLVGHVSIQICSAPRALPTAHFDRNPLGRGRLAVFLRCSLDPYESNMGARSRLEKQPTDLRQNAWYFGDRTLNQPMSTANELDQHLDALGWVTEPKRKLLDRLGLVTWRDLLEHYPRR